jgi:hypothetical protein
MTYSERAKAWYQKQLDAPYGKHDSAEFHILGLLLDSHLPVEKDDDQLSFEEAYLSKEPTFGANLRLPLGTTPNDY